MTEQEKNQANELGNTLANLLLKCGIVKFNMDLEKQHIDIDFDTENPNLKLLEKVTEDFEDINIRIN